jgi:hypothetical protein
MPKLISDSTILRRSDRVILIVSASRTPFVSASAEDVRDSIDRQDIGFRTISAEVLALDNLVSTLGWYSVTVEITSDEIAVSQLKALAQRYIDDYNLTIWNVAVREVQDTRGTIGDALGDLLPSVPTNTTISLVAVAAIVVVIFIVVN